MTLRGKTLPAAVGLALLLTAAVFAAEETKVVPKAAAPADMKIWHAVVLGLTEGVTEYLPVSSTGHLHIVGHMLGFDPDKDEAAKAYEIVIQAGAIFAVLWLYFGRIRSMASGVRGRDAAGRRLAVNVIVAFLPAAVIGLLFEKQIKHYLFGLGPIVVAWFVGGVLILVYSMWRRRHAHSDNDLESLTWKSSLIIGCAQVLAMWPGTSRSLVTIFGGLAVGLSLSAAVEFSFLLGLVTLTAATGYEALKYGHLIFWTYGFLGPFIGMTVALLSAIAAVKWMVSYLSRHELFAFGYYRIALAVVVALLILLKALP